MHQIICDTTARMCNENRVKILFWNVGSEEMVALDRLDLPKPGLVETINFSDVPGAA
ncbi:MAG TPA: hypothetical protein V6D22_14680 [Candidatus Obscuribacterales bacterium]